MVMFKIPGVSFSLNRALGITQAKQKLARETGIPTSKAGLERKLGKIVLNAIFGKKRWWFHTPVSCFVHFSYRCFLYQVFQLSLPMRMASGCNIRVVALARHWRVSFARRMVVATLSLWAGIRNLARWVRCSQVMFWFIRLEVTRDWGMCWLWLMWLARGRRLLSCVPRAIHQQGRRISFAILSLWRIRGSSSMVTRVPLGCRSSISERMSWDFIKVAWSLHSLLQILQTLQRLRVGTERV